MSTHTAKPLCMAALVALMLISACERSSSDAANGAGGDSSSAMPQAAQSAEHVAQGTVNSVDRAAGTVNISHGPVASANWPAMTMSFKLEDPGAASGVAPGQRVEFRFTIQSGMDATVTDIERVE